jgi:hypothetical protein
MPHPSNNNFKQNLNNIFYILLLYKPIGATPRSPKVMFESSINVGEVTVAGESRNLLGKTNTSPATFSMPEPEVNFRGFSCSDLLQLPNSTTRTQVPTRTAVACQPCRTCLDISTHFS